MANGVASGVPLKVTNEGTGDGIFIDQNGNGAALYIDSESSTDNTIYVEAATTTAISLRYITSSLTSGTGAYFSTNSASYTGTNGLFRVGITNTSASGRGLRVDNAGTGYGVFLDQNGNGHALYIDSEATGAHGIYVRNDVATTGRAIYAYCNSASFSGSGLIRSQVHNASATGNSFYAYNNGTGTGVIIDQNGNGIALNVDSEATSANGIALSAPTSTDAFKINQQHASTPYGMQIDFSVASPNNTSQYFQYFQDSTADRAILWSNGSWSTATGTYGTISDRFYKTDIVDARDYWEDWKAVQFHTFTKGGKKQFGVIADEMEQVFPGLVHTSPDENHPDGESQWVDTMNLNHIGGKVLQEALKRIEALEAEIAALKSA